MVRLSVCLHKAARIFFNSRALRVLCELWEPVLALECCVSLGVVGEGRVPSLVAAAVD
jgi:hypothetical protein